MKHLLWIPILLIAFIAGCKKNKPAAIATLTTTAATSTTANTAQTGGNITNNGGSTITKSGVCWATHTSPTVSDSITSNGALMGSFISNLSGLLGNMTYYVKAYAINSVGTAYGNEVSFITSKGLPTVTTTVISNSVALSAASGGNVLSDGGYSITARGVVWSTTPHPTTSSFKTTDGTGVGIFASALTPLASQTVYYVRAYATSSFGTSYGNEISFPAASSNTVADIDGNVYSYITIGTQTWITSNLKTTHYRNGDPITNGLSTGFNFVTGTTGAYSFPNGDSTNDNTYGKFYNLPAVSDSRNIAPAGWHIPSDAEWQILEFYEGMSASDTGFIGNRGTIGPKLLTGGTSGLNLQLSGYLSTASGSYLVFQGRGYFYTSTPVAVGGPGANYFRTVYSSTDPNTLTVRRQYANYGMSVRCVKD